MSTSAEKIHFAHVSQNLNTAIMLVCCYTIEYRDPVLLHDELFLELY